MKDFDRAQAQGFIVSQILASAPEYDKIKCEELIARIMDADFDFMRDAGVIVDDEFSPDVYYDDDEAFDYVAERIFNEASGEDEQFLTDLLEDYFDNFEKFMSQKGMLDWE